MTTFWYGNYNNNVMMSKVSVFYVLLISEEGLVPKYYIKHSDLCENLIYSLFQNQQVYIQNLQLRCLQNSSLVPTVLGGGGYNSIEFC